MFRRKYAMMMIENPMVCWWDDELPEEEDDNW